MVNGVSQTNPFGLSQKDYGALKDFAGGDEALLRKAIGLTDILTPKQEEIDPAMLAFLYFSRMGELASQPGATLFGSAAGAATSPAEYLMRRKEADKKADASRAGTAVNLISTLKKSQAGSGKQDTYAKRKAIGIELGLTGPELTEFVLYGTRAPAGSSGSATKPYTVEILDDTAFATAFPGVTLPNDKKIDLTNKQVALLPAGSFSIEDTSSTSVGTPKQYSVSEENLAGLNEALGTNLQRDTLGNVTLTTDQFVKGQNFLGGAAGKTPQGSQYERLFSSVNNIGTRLADPNLVGGVSQAEKNEYAANYQKLVVGGEFTEIVDGKEITRKKPGIDLSSTTNLPIPDGLDLNKIIEQRSQKFDQNQSTSATFGSRMLFNEGILRNMLASGYVLTLQDVAQIRTMQTLGLGNIGVTPEAQQFHVAAQNWVAAQLRNESGAAIAASEYADALLQYFPKVGDSAETIKQKQALREEATKGMINASGDAFSVIYPDGVQYLTYTSDGQEYQILNPQGYANEKLARTELGQNLFFKEAIAGKTTQALRKMLANPNAANLYTDQMLDMIEAELAKPERNP